MIKVDGHSVTMKGSTERILAEMAGLAQAMKMAMAERGMTPDKATDMVMRSAALGLLVQDGGIEGYDHDVSTVTLVEACVEKIQAAEAENAKKVLH